MPAETQPREPGKRHIVEADGAAFYVRDSGDGGTPLFLLHGLGGDSTSWTLNQPVLSAQRRVIAVDLPGHGRSGTNLGDATVPTFGTMISALPDALGIESFHLLGLSFGGAVAIEMALRLGPRVRSLTCLSATGLGDEVDTDFIHGYLDAEDTDTMRRVLSISFCDTRLINDAMVGFALAGRADPALRARVTRIADANFADGRQKFTYLDRLGDLAAPLHLIWGREDRIVPVGHATAVAGAQSTHIFERTGHMPHIEAAEAFNRRVLDILQESPSSA